MRFFDFRVGWRALVRRPLHTSAMLAGLAVALAAAFLLLGFVHCSFSYDSAVPDNRHVYVLKHKLNLLAQPQWVEQMPLPAYDVLANSGLPLTLCAVLPHRATLKLDGMWKDITFTEVSDTFPALFGVRASAGDLAAALARPDGLALTPAGARMLFGSTAALGRIVHVNGIALRVLALLPEPPPNTTVPYQALVGTGTALWTPGGRDRMRKEWMALAGKLYVRTAQPEAVRAAMEREATRVVASIVGPDTAQRLGTVVEVGITPLAEAYFDTSVAAFNGGPRAARPAVLALAGLALVILALATTNYVNLATLRVLERSREIAVRKTLGAGSARLAAQFVAEGIVLALAATVAGLLLAWLLLPVFGALMDRPLAAFLSPAALAAAVALGLAVGVACAVWPVRLALRVRPAQALAGRSDSEPPGGAWLRRSLTVFQFAVAIALCALALAIGWQARFAAQTDPGFALDAFRLLELPGQADMPARRAFRAALARVPGGAGVTSLDRAFGAPGIPLSAGFRRPGGDERRIDLARLGPEFFAVARIAPLAGRAFDPARAPGPQAQDVLLNEPAALALGFPAAAAAVGQSVDGPGGPLRVVGIAPPLRHQGLRHALLPMVYMVDQGDADVLMIRSALPAADLERALAPLWRHYFPGHALAVRPARAAFEESSADDRRAASLLTLGCIVATGIAASGIYVLAAASVRRRGREIVLRKLHGAGRWAIGRLVGAEFALLLAVAAALALPPSAWGLAHYLAGYTAASPLAWWALPAALGLGALVAFAATLRHALAALRLRPAAALRQGD